MSTQRFSPLLALLIGCAGAAPERATSRPSEAPTANAGGMLKTDWFAVVGPRLIAAGSDFVAAGSGYQAEAGGLKADLDERGLRLHLGDDDIAVSLRAWGRADLSVGAALSAPAPGACVESGDLLPSGDCMQRLEQEDGDLVAWTAGRAVGVQQGWELTSPPAGSGPLLLDLAVDGAEVEVQADGLAWLVGLDGALVRYSELDAWDANGDPLPAWFEAQADGIAVWVDDTDAVYPVSIDPIATSVTSTLTGTTTGTDYGFAVAFAGDVNNDGYDDVIVGAPSYSSSRGAFYVYHGASSGLGTSSRTAVSGTVTNSLVGYSVDSAGDTNGDGYDDVVIGAPGIGSYKGAAYVFRGSSSGVSATTYSTINGSSTSGQFGFAVAGAGDINGDSYDDVIVGANTVSTSYGAASTFHGQSSGIATTASRTITGSSGYYLGASVAGAGDVNGDGYDDVLIGAPGVSSNSGAAYLYKGTSSGIGSSATSSLTSPATGAYFGVAVGRAWDVNGDGYDDVIVGASDYSSGKGAAYVYHGKSTGLTTSAKTSLTGSIAVGYFGIWVTGLDDADGDGYGDVLVTAYGVSTFSGAAYTYAGSSAGISSTVSDTLTGASSSSFGICADGGGDVNGDGYGDAIISATGGGGGYGAVYLYLGEAQDADGDGYAASDDCDDTDPTIYPGATETTGDEIDSDCDDKETCYVDADGDRYRVSTTVTSADTDCRDSGEAPSSFTSGDCDDSNAAVYPGATETIGDEIDEDCDSYEVCYVDADGDDYRVTSTVASSDEDCADAGEAAAAVTSGDCDDTDADINPGATEIVGDGVDQDCDDRESCYQDNDDDGYRTDATRPSTDEDCDDATEASDDTPDGDCDDGDADINPGESEVPGDGIDQNCDGADDADADDDGFDGESSGGTDCDDEDANINPDATEVPYDGIDNDCVDGDLDDADGDGSVAAAAGGDDCDDGNADTYPGAPELQDGLDNDCDGLTEDGQVDTGGHGDDTGGDDTAGGSDGDGGSGGGACGYGLTPMAMLLMVGAGSLARRDRIVKG